MGSCVSIHRNHVSAMKAQLSISSKTEKLLIPVNEKPVPVNGSDRTVADVARFHGSKDESFFDSQPWLESDCEDDFFSVNGDFTPSRGNTPVHHNFSLGKLQVNKTEETNGSITPEPSPPDKKKRLSELFQESLRGDYSIDDEKAKSTNGTPYLSGATSVVSSERTPNGLLIDEDKSVKSAQCCLPRLISSRSFRERKKKMSPAQNVG